MADKYTNNFSYVNTNQYNMMDGGNGSNCDEYQYNNRALHGQTHESFDERLTQNSGFNNVTNVNVYNNSSNLGTVNHYQNCRYPLQNYNSESVPFRPAYFFNTHQRLPPPKSHYAGSLNASVRYPIMNGQSVVPAIPQNDLSFRPSGVSTNPNLLRVPDNASRNRFSSSNNSPVIQPSMVTRKDCFNLLNSPSHLMNNVSTTVPSVDHVSDVALTNHKQCSSNFQMVEPSVGIKTEPELVKFQTSCNNIDNKITIASQAVSKEQYNQSRAFTDKTDSYFKAHELILPRQQSKLIDPLVLKHDSCDTKVNVITVGNCRPDKATVLRGPLDIDLPAEEIQAFMQKEASKFQTNNVDLVVNQGSANYNNVIGGCNIDVFSRPTCLQSPVLSSVKNSVSSEIGKNNVIDRPASDILPTHSSFPCNNSSSLDLRGNSTIIGANSAINVLDNNKYQPGAGTNSFSNLISSLNTQPVTSLEIGCKPDVSNSPANSGVDSYSSSQLRRSPEKKYLHLISDKLSSRSPERQFLERINNRSRRTRSRSPSVESSSSHRRRRSRSKSNERPMRYSRSPKRRNYRSGSRSPLRSYHAKRSRSPRNRYRNRYHSRSPGRSRNPSKQNRDQKRDISRSPSRKRRNSSADLRQDKWRSRSRERKYSSYDKNPKNPSKETNVSLSGDKSKLKCDSNDDKSVKSSSSSSSAVSTPADKKKPYSEREELLIKYRKDYCSDVDEINHKLNELSKLNVEELVKKETQFWTRMSPANLYYESTDVVNVLQGTVKLKKLCDEFEDVLIKRAERVRDTQPKYDPPARKKRMRLAKHKSEKCSSSSSSSSSSDSDYDSSSDEEDCTMEELERKRSHPFRLHQELWFNDVGEMNDGPLCRCSAKARRSGIRHNIYAGELNIPKCDTNKNNANALYHYRITISPPTNFLIKTPTIIPHDDHEFLFEGFSMFSHIRLNKLPVCKVIRFNIEYTILYFEERMPENFTIRELDLFYEYLFKELLELVDLDFKAGGDVSRCDQFHFMPRFVRELPENGKEILSMNEVLSYLLKNCDDLIKNDELSLIQDMPQYDWQKKVDIVKGMVVTMPGMKPCSLRVDQLDRDKVEGKTSCYPEIVHFGIRPPQLSYAGNPEYQKAWREYVKFRHLLANMPKPSFEDKRKLEVKENKLQEMRTQSKMKRDVTVTVNSEGFKKTGIMCDIVQHAMLIPVLVSHLRFHCSLGVLEDTISYKFKNRFLLQLALTHPSYRENFGTNPDHARNSLTNCGIRQPEYGDRRIHYMNTRKRGINTLINIMSRFGKKTETESNITHNERLEFLGDAVVEFITSIHLFHMFPDLEEGGLATYRAAIVQNQHLAVLAKILKLNEFMLYAHGSDLCHDLELRHAMANCFEALMGALFLDGGIEVADKVFGETLFRNHPDILDTWVDYPPHPLQEQEPFGDRKWIPRFELLKRLTEFEDVIGVQFTHIRLLARAFTDRSIGFTNLTLGSNQRLEFLGDTVLQLIASEYLYKYFPEHHEGHLSLLRSSLVNNRTQAVVCNDLGMTRYALYHNPKAELKTKDRADLLEAFLGALYVDKGLDYCEVFCNVCFFPRLQTFIMRQDWNDPKSKLQQCCLTLRTMEGGEPEIPIYKVIECMGPTNTRVYTVAVYFKGRRLAEASGHSIQQAEMNAAKKALQKSHGLFPQLDHQKRVIAKSLKSQHSSRAGSEGSSSVNLQIPGKIHIVNKPELPNAFKNCNTLPKNNVRDKNFRNNRSDSFKKPVSNHKR